MTISALDGAHGMGLDGNAVRSVDRAAALLLALGDSQGEAGVTELARRLGLHKSTASRLLATLQKRGLVEQDDEPGPNLIPVGDWTGRASPLHCIASGKVLLSSMAEREVLRIVRRGLVAYTERTITELEPLLEEMARIRRRGYATALGEYESGLNAVSAPVHDARGAVIAAVDIWGPAFRLTPRRIPELAAQAREAAAAISVRLGGAAA